MEKTVIDPGLGPPPAGQTGRAGAEGPSPPLPRQSALTIGCFDGIHLGHQKLIEALQSEARRLAAKSVLCLLDPHPRKILGPEKNFKRLCALDETESILRPLGLDCLGIIPFTPAFSRLSPEGFVRRFLCPRLAPRTILAGYDFSFGFQGKGSAGFLKRLGGEMGFSVRQIPPVLYRGKPVSSSRIREALSAGDVPAAAGMLGRPFSLCGPVAKGAGRGRQLGFPTANLALKGKFLPKKGVYAAKARVRGARQAPAVVNIGVRPTFRAAGGSGAGEGDALAEAHIIHGSPDLYGRELELELICRLRAEKSFHSPAALAAQIKKDIEKTLNSF